MWSQIVSYYIDLCNRFRTYFYIIIQTIFYTLLYLRSFTLILMLIYCFSSFYELLLCFCQSNCLGGEIITSLKQCKLLESISIYKHFGPVWFLFLNSQNRKQCKTHYKTCFELKNCFQRIILENGLFSERIKNNMFLETLLYFQFRKNNTIGNILFSDFFCSLKRIFWKYSLKTQPNRPLEFYQT